MKLCLCGHAEHEVMVITGTFVEWACSVCRCPLYRASMNDVPLEEGDPESRIVDNEHMEAHYEMN